MAAPTEVFKTFTLEQLQVIAKHERIHEKNIDLDLSKKSAVVKAVSREATDAGVRQLVSLFKLATLKEICEPLELDLSKNNPNHKGTYQKRLKEKMVEMGIADFLNEFMDEKRLKIFVETLGEAPEGKDKKTLVEQATRLINFTGISTFLSTFDTHFLQELMSEMKLKCKTDNKTTILEAIAMQTDARSEESSKDREDLTFSKEKLPIKKGITYQDIFQHYNVEELVDYCRENELKVSGKKPILINRILDFLDGDLENTTAINRSEKKEKKDDKKEKKETKEKKSQKKEKKETKKKEEKKESESEESEEEQESASEPEEKVEKKEVEKPASPKNPKKSPAADAKKKVSEEKKVEEKAASEDEAVEEEESKKEKKAKNTKKSSKKN